MSKNKKLRSGYTTGSCAAASAKAALYMLLNKQVVDHVEIDTPAGVKLKLEITDVELTEETASCAVVKDGGDDPDTTHGMKIYAEVRLIDQGIEVKNGPGVGVVTKPGLPVEVGEPAINPVPMKMIEKEVMSILPPNQGVEITISIPGGEEKAKRTLNPKLGIVGGLSILGTSGIVKPMSEEAYKVSLVPQIKTALAAGFTTLVFTPGRIGANWAVARGIPEDAVIETSNFIGYMLEQAADLGVTQVVLLGHIGKLGKVAAGIFHTHNRMADGRMETLAAHAGLLGADQNIIRKIMECTTTDSAVELLYQENLEQVFKSVAEKTALRARDYVHGDLVAGAILLDRKGNILALDEHATEIMGRDFAWEIKSS